MSISFTGAYLINCNDPIMAAEKLNHSKYAGYSFPGDFSVRKTSDFKNPGECYKGNVLMLNGQDAKDFQTLDTALFVAGYGKNGNESYRSMSQKLINLYAAKALYKSSIY